MSTADCSLPVPTGTTVENSNVWNTMTPISLRRTSTSPPPEWRTTPTESSCAGSATTAPSSPTLMVWRSVLWEARSRMRTGSSEPTGSEVVGRQERPGSSSNWPTRRWNSTVGRSIGSMRAPRTPTNGTVSACAPSHRRATPSSATNRWSVAKDPVQLSGRSSHSSITCGNLTNRR